jgi:cytochrome P450
LKNIIQIDRIWGEAGINGNTDASVIGDTLKKMTYLEAFVKEVLRFHPPVQFIIRKCAKPVKLCGYNIPSKTVVSILSFSCRFLYISSYYIN